MVLQQINRETNVIEKQVPERKNIREISPQANMKTQSLTR